MYGQYTIITQYKMKILSTTNVCTNEQMVLQAQVLQWPASTDNTGRSSVGRRPTGVAHSKITHVRVLSWPLPVRTSLYFLTCHSHEILSRNFQ